MIVQASMGLVIKPEDYAPICFQLIYAFLQFCFATHSVNPYGPKYSAIDFWQETDITNSPPQVLVQSNRPERIEVIDRRTLTKSFARQ
jgi:hypothetical protein